jgi:hypothetical protein
MAGQDRPRRPAATVTDKSSAPVQGSVKFPTPLSSLVPVRNPLSCSLFQFGRSRMSNWWVDQMRREFSSG